jgi:uncharacterized membrane protein YsdA (DUF1294 family)
LFIALFILPIAGAYKLFSQFALLWVLLVYPIASLFTYYFYWSDKRKAKNNEWRIPEANLHFWSLIGGWPGALIAQQQFRHKTKKTPFQIVFWLTVIAHQLLWFDWLLMDGQWLVKLLLR